MAGLARVHGGEPHGPGRSRKAGPALGRAGPAGGDGAGEAAVEITGDRQGGVLQVQQPSAASLTPKCPGNMRGPRWPRGRGGGAGFLPPRLRVDLRLIPCHRATAGSATRASQPPPRLLPDPAVKTHGPGETPSRSRKQPRPLGLLPTSEPEPDTRSAARLLGSPSPPAPRAPSPPAPPTAGRPSLGPRRWHPRPPGHTPARARPPPACTATCATRTLDSGRRPLVLPSVVRGLYFPSPLSVHPLLAADQSYWAGQLRGRRPARNVSPGDGASRAGAGLPGLFLPRGPTSASPHPGHAGDCTAGHPRAREQGRGGRQQQPPRESQTQPQTLVAGAQTPPRGRPRTRELPPPAGTCWPVVRPGSP